MNAISSRTYGPSLAATTLIAHCQKVAEPPRQLSFARELQAAEWIGARGPNREYLSSGRGTVARLIAAPRQAEAG
jgi:hypothetical protein